PLAGLCPERLALSRCWRAGGVSPLRAGQRQTVSRPSGGSRPPLAWGFYGGTPDPLSFPMSQARRSSRVVANTASTALTWVACAFVPGARVSEAVGRAVEEVAAAGALPWMWTSTTTAVKPKSLFGIGLGVLPRMTPSKGPTALLTTTSVACWPAGVGPVAV